MIGRVEFLHALLPVAFRLEDQSEQTIEFVIDTGFTGELSLPLFVVNSLGLSYIEDISANLADDQTVRIPIYEAVILWNGVERDVRILATGRRPLLGTALLEGYEFVAQFAEGGLVTVEEF